MKQAMIFAAGLGTRLKPLTDHMPKALVEIGGEPLLKRVICLLKEAGFTHIVVNVHHFASQIIDYLKENDNFGTDLSISDESSGLLDTGGGLKKTALLFDQDSPVLIHNVDILSNVQLGNFYDAKRDMPDVDALLLVSERNTKRYLLFDETMRLMGWTNIETGEVKSPYPHLNPQNYKKFAFSGIHLVSENVFKAMDAWPDKFPIMDFYLKECNKLNIRGYLKKNLHLMDVGKQETLHDAETFLNGL